MITDEVRLCLDSLSKVCVYFIDEYSLLCPAHQAFRARDATDCWVTLSRECETLLDSLKLIYTFSYAFMTRNVLRSSIVRLPSDNRKMCCDKNMSVTGLNHTILSIITYAMSCLFSGSCNL